MNFVCVFSLMTYLMHFSIIHYYQLTFSFPFVVHQLNLIVWLSYTPTKTCLPLQLLPFIHKFVIQGYTILCPTLVLSSIKTAVMFTLTQSYENYLPRNFLTFLTFIILGNSTLPKLHYSVLQYSKSIFDITSSIQYSPHFKNFNILGKVINTTLQKFQYLRNISCFLQFIFFHMITSTQQKFT